METGESRTENLQPAEKTAAIASTEVSSKGVAAIRGETVSPDSNQPDRAVIQQISPREEVAPSFKRLDSSAEYDLDVAARQADADKAVRYHETASPGRVCEYRRIRSGITEVLTEQNIPGSVRADPFSKSGTNFPNFDLFSPDEAASVKALSLKDGEPRRIYRQYFSDLLNPSSEKNQKAAERLTWLKQNDDQAWKELVPQLPSDVREGKDVQSVQKALAERATLRIPEDQVDKVQEDLKAYIARHPEKFGLAGESSPDERAREIKQMVGSRVRSIDERYTTAHYQAKAAEMVNLRDEDLARLARRR